MDLSLQYERHLISGDEIRLMRLDPGSVGSPLKATLYYCHLSENLAYQALSYAWGNPFDQDHPSWSQCRVPALQFDLCVNNSILRITDNLHSALLQLRQRTEPLTLWIDAICIDQAHDEEKTCQLRQMREIYEGATQVLIWLGPSDTTSDAAMCVLRAGYRYSLRTKPFTKPGQIYVDAPRPNSSQEVDDEMTALSLANMFGMVPGCGPPIPDYPIQAVADLLNRAYWGRGWCWQECAVAKRVTIACGAEILEDGDMCLETFLVTWDSLRDHSGITPYSLDHRPWAVLEIHRSYRNLAHLKEIGFEDDPRTKTPEPRMTDAGKSWLLREAHASLSMKELLQESDTSWLKATNKEDQIFALLGMAVDAQELGIKVNCAIAWEKLYTQVAAAYAKRGDLWFLRYCQDALDGRSTSLPSWVPDWSQGYRGVQIDQHYAPPANPFGPSPGEQKPDLQDVESCGRLRLSGIIADEIAWVSEERVQLSVNELNTSLRKGLYQWIRAVASQCSSQSHRILWTVMIANSNMLPLPQEYHKKSTKEEMREILDTAFDSILERDEVLDTELRDAIESYLRCLMQATKFRCVFRTQKGRLGLGPIGIREGDHISMFAAFNTVIVIRSIATTLSDGAIYQILGQSYVHELLEDQEYKAHAEWEEIILQ